MEQISAKILRSLPPQLRALLAPEPDKELLSAIDECLLVFEDGLYRTADGARAILSRPDEPTELAEAARELLGDAASDSSVLLLLAPDEFVAVSKELPGISRDTLGSALRLQTGALLPACDEPLVLAVNADSAELFESHIALWMRQERLNELFAAFAEQGIFLAAVRARTLVIATDEEDTRVVESTSAGLASVASRNGVVCQWLQLHHTDQESDEFAEQWQQELKSLPTAKRFELSTAEDYLQHIDSSQGTAYSFFPSGALQARQRVQRAKRLRAALVSAAAVALLAILPFLWQAFQLGAAERELRNSQQLAANARADQAVVVEFENEWGAVSDFPEQNIAEVMYALQGALAPDQLTALEISEGLISIEGNSEDPQAILQKLEQDPLFTEVVFARATNNTRYFIDLRLSPVNFEGYFLRYFPDE